MRNVLAVLLAALAAIAGASAWGGSVADKALTEPTTIQQTLGGLIDDDGVRSMVATRVKAQLVERLPDGVIPEKLATAVEKTVQRASDAVLDDPSMRQAWLDSLDASRQLYVQRVREEGGSAGRVEVVLDPVATVVAGHVTDAISSLGIEVSPAKTVPWRLDQTIGDISPLAALSVPLMKLVTVQSEHWFWYGVAAAVLALLALLAARRRAVAVLAAGFVAGAAGLVGIWGAGVVAGLGGAAPNPILAAAAGSVGELVRSTSTPVAWTGVVVLILGIVMMIIGGTRARRRSLDF